MLTFLTQSGYEGGATVLAPAADQITGYSAGSRDDRRILAFLTRSGYEGGGTVVNVDGAGGL